MDVRRVVTGESAGGKSVVASDERVAPVTATLLGAGGFYPLWGSDAPVKLPQDGSPLPALGWFPPASGFRFAVVSLAPEGPLPPHVNLDEAVAELSSKVPGLVEVLEPDNPAMHTTDTIDFNFIVSGDIWLELDDGVEIHLTAGDCVVQNGVRHAWHNRSSEACVMAVAIVGATR